MSRTDWHEHHADVSALIADDDNFCKYIKSIWGTGNRDTGAQRSCQQLNRNNDVRGNDDNHSTMSTPSDAVDVGNGHSGNPVGVGSRSGQRSQAPRAAAEMANSRVSSPRPLPREAWAPQPAGERERAHTLLRRDARVGGTGIAIPMGVLGLLWRAHTSLTAGGVRGAFRVLKGFREEDRTGDGKVSLSGFKTAVGGAQLGLKEPEMRIIFQVHTYLVPARRVKHLGVS